MFLEICQNPQKNTCARASFIMGLHTSGLQLYWGGDSGAGAYLWILRNFYEHIFYRTPLGDCFCKLFGNWWGNSYVDFLVIIIIYFRFIFGKQKLDQNMKMCTNFLSKIIESKGRVYAEFNEFNKNTIFCKKVVCNFSSV